MSEAELAQEYRRHATAIRAAAKFETRPQTILILKRIAFDYEQMADALEGIHKTHKALGKI